MCILLFIVFSNETDLYLYSNIIRVITHFLQILTIFVPVPLITGNDYRTAEDGKVAVEMLRLKDPKYYDCILMDIQMPYMNGYEATKAIREMNPDISIPIIALSANAFEEDKAKSLEAGMNAHIAKPIVINELLKVLSTYIK